MTKNWVLIDLDEISYIEAFRFGDEIIFYALFGNEHFW